MSLLPVRLHVRSLFALLAAVPTALLIACGGGDGGDGGLSTEPGTVTLSVGSGTLALAAGGTGTLPVTVSRGGSFGGAVMLSVEGAPAGVTALVSPSTLDATATNTTLSVAATAAVPPGTVTLTLRGRGSGVSDATAAVSVTIADPASSTVGITLSPTSATIAAGGTQQFTATVTGTENTAVTWSSSAAQTATVSTAGLATGVAPGITTIQACAVADPSRCAQAALTVTTASDPSATLLVSGVPVAGISGAEDSQRLYRIAVPAGATQLDVRTSGGSGDVDLYVRRGQPPSSAAVDCWSEGVATDESCTIPTPAAGDWYILLVGFEAYSGVTLTATVSTSGTPGGGVSLSFGEPTMTVPQAGQRTQSVTVVRNGYTGAIDLEVEPITDQFVQVDLSRATLAPTEDAFSLTVRIAYQHTGTSFPVRVRAKTAGRPDVVDTVMVDVRTQFTYSGGFTGPSWEMYDISSVGDRCEFMISVRGTVTVGFTSLNQEGVMTTRVQATVTATAKQGTVGNTTCNGGSSTIDVSDGAQAIYPFVGGRVDRAFTDWSIQFYPLASLGEAGSSGGASGDFRVHIAGSSSSGIIGEQPAPIPLVLLPR
jgi:hypothetical protein